MPYKDIADKRSAGRRWAKKHKASLAEKARRYYLANKEKKKKQRKERKKTHPEAYERAKKRDVVALKIVKRALKSRLVEHFGGKCICCGIEDDPCIYDFHHRDPAQKDSEIANLITRTRDWDVVVKEAQKCDLVCSNCHRKIHFGTLTERGRKYLEETS